MTLLLESALKVTAIIVAGLAATLLARRQSAAVRHWLIAAAFTAAAAVPLLQTALPSWQLAIDPGAYMAAAPSALSTLSVLSGRSGTSGVPASGATGSGTDAVRAAARGAARATDDDSPRLIRAVTSVWMAGAVIFLAMLGIGAAHLMWLAARARIVTAGAWRAICDEYAVRYGITRPVVLLQSHHPTLLVTWGWRRPKIVLPFGADGWSEHRIRAILAHELAHVQRGDSVILLLAEVLRAAHWFNPAVWMARGRLRRESEHACDDAAIGCGIDAADYAGHLVDVARIMRVRRQAWWPAPALIGTSYFERRIKAMLNHTARRSPAPRWFRVASVAAMLVIAVVVAAAQTGFARMSGTILDPNGGYIPKATIVLTHTASAAKHEVRANATGAYDLVGLVAGDYQLEVSTPGFATYRETLTMSPAQALTRSIVMQLGTLQETITVRDDGGASRAPVAQSATVAAPAAKACEASTVGGRIVPPTKIADRRPRYPQNLRDQSIGGVVDMEAVVGGDGLVKTVDVKSAPNPEMAAAASEAVQQWRYTPTLLNCAPVDVRMTVLVNFLPRQ